MIIMTDDKTTTSNDHELRHPTTTTTNDDTTTAMSNHHGVVHPTQASCGAKEPRPKCSRSLVWLPCRERLPRQVLHGDFKLKTEKAPPSVERSSLGNLKAPADEGSSEPSELNTAGTGSSDLQQPHGQPLRHFPKTLPVLHQGNKERNDRQTMEGNPAAGDNFRHPAPHECGSLRLAYPVRPA